MTLANMRDNSVRSLWVVCGSAITRRSPEMPAAISPYSMAVAPDSFFKKELMRRRIRVDSPLLDLRGCVEIRNRTVLPTNQLIRGPLFKI